MKVEKKISLEKKIWDDFRAICTIKGTSMNNILNKLIKDYNESNKDSLIRAYKLKRG